MRFKIGAALVVFLVADAAIVAAAEEYPSKSSCIRAGETQENCDTLFPEPSRPQFGPGPIEACTWMMDEATAYIRQAINYARLDDIPKAHTQWQRAESLRKSAENCAKSARGTKVATAAWVEARGDCDAENEIFQEVVRARSQQRK